MALAGLVRLPVCCSFLFKSKDWDLLHVRFRMAYEIYWKGHGRNYRDNNSSRCILSFTVTVYALMEASFTFPN